MTRASRGRAASAAAIAAAIAAASAALVLALTGCAAAERDPAASVQNEPAGTAELEGRLTVFAAASLIGAFDELATRFEQLHPRLEVAPITYDGSSVLATQLIEGAPADVFASADERNLATVAAEGLIAGESGAFAANVLEIAVQPGNPLGIESLDDLVETTASGAAPIVVTCAPEVPCGTASAALLDRAGFELAPASEEQNVGAVLSKVRAGEADAGLVYVTDVQAAGAEVEGVEIEGADAATNVYPIAALTGSANPEAAAAFVEFVRSPEGAEVLASFGFGAP
ncbi:molybdate ABC transporter substrate-binding protein [Agromyces badenianii]|uniref:molybdate ABC transporter substrate-binding protein n=1 Tax=Agromyces badenianii TaxID=2080742 RepID=UPI000D5932A7|nr:molybdate ABC transporter substrate-binding protein [Agromyces badenianii]PWC04923.1 molybdate ABC transporter substrate-binding protein [Agromyces badenianii]